MTTIERRSKRAERGRTPVVAPASVHLCLAAPLYVHATRPTSILGRPPNSRTSSRETRLSNLSIRTRMYTRIFYIYICSYAYAKGKTIEPVIFLGSAYGYCSRLLPRSTLYPSILDVHVVTFFFFRRKRKERQRGKSFSLPTKSVHFHFSSLRSFPSIVNERA